jgi:tripartite-type tricarboxylate transporter receptor subunit TctC
MFSLSVLLAGSLTSVGAAKAQESAAPYVGKNVTMTISYGPGGGYDIYGRLVARYLGGHLPGDPTIVVKNMAAAGGIVGANYLYNVAQRDGTEIGMINQNAALGQVIGTPGVKYDARDFSWVGRITSGIEVFYAWHTSPVKTIAQAKAHEIVAGGTGPTSSSEIMPRVMNDLIGTKFKMVSGYPDGESVALALQRGEVDAYVTVWSVVKARNADWLRDKKIAVLVQFGLERHGDLTEVPTLLELATNDEDRRVIALFGSGDTVGRAVVAPPFLSTDRTAILRTGFEATMNDQKLVDEANKAGIDLDFMSGEKLQTSIANAFDVSPAVVAKAAALNGPRK